MPWSIPALSSSSHYHSPLCHAHSGPQAFARAFPLPGMHLHFPSSLNSNPPPQFEMFPPSPPLLAQFHSLCSQSKWSIPYQHSFDSVLYSQYRAWHRNPKIRLRDQDIPFCLCSRKTRAIPHEHWWEQPWNQLPQTAPHMRHWYTPSLSFQRVLTPFLDSGTERTSTFFREEVSGDQEGSYSYVDLTGKR